MKSVFAAFSVDVEVDDGGNDGAAQTVARSVMIDLLQQGWDITISDADPLGSPVAAQPANIWTVTYAHKHGVDVGVYATEELARRGCAAIAEQYVDDIDDEAQAEVRTALNDGRWDDAARAYFDATSGEESADITETALITEGPDGL